MRPERDARLKGQIRIRRRIMKTDCGIQSSRSTRSGDRRVASQKTMNHRMRGMVKNVARR